MTDNTLLKRQVKVCNGNKAAAYGVRLSRPDVITFYPITPQTPLLEYLYEWRNAGLLDTEFIEVEGEISVMAAASGASAAGARTFTATCGAGLSFMFDSYLWPPALRLPVVMANVNREASPPVQVSAGNSDMMVVKDGGWIQVHVEENQEILDSMIMAYRLAEDPEILLPVQVSYDGFVLSHLSQKVEIPAQSEVDAFLEPVRSVDRPKLDPDEGNTFASWVRGVLLAEFYYKHLAAMDRVKRKVYEVEEEFYKIFGRRYGGLIEEYRTEDAEIVLIGYGSEVGSMRVVVDRKREEGMKIGLIKVRVFRPFPVEQIVNAVRGKKAIGVLEKNLCWGWNSGHLFMEMKAALSELGSSIPMADFLDGFGGLDVTLENVARSADITWQAAQGKPFEKVTWLPLEE
jgi:pyruvate/2-oxoacid:ferredoxin oxidoreductase alpha subunit